MIGAPYFLIAALLVTGAAAVFDWKTGHMPNWLTLGALVLAPFGHLGVSIAAGSSGTALTNAGLSIAGAGVCALVPYLLWRAEGMWGGDVKLLAALGALLRPMVGIETEMYAFIAGMLYALGKMAYEGKLMRTLANSVTLMFNPLRQKGSRKEVPREMMTKMRLGPSIFAGTVVMAVLHWRML